MGLLPLEFSDCMLDSPYFRENLKAHEKQMEQTYADLKTIRKEIQDVVDAAKALSKAKRSLASSLSTFQVRNASNLSIYKSFVFTTTKHHLCMSIELSNKYWVTKKANLCFD